MNYRDRLIRLRLLNNKAIVKRLNNVVNTSEITNFIIKLDKKNEYSRDEVLQLNDYIVLLDEELKKISIGT